MLQHVTAARSTASSLRDHQQHTRTTVVRLPSRYIRLIAHVDVVIPAAVDAPQVVLMDSQGREQHTGQPRRHYPSAGLQQQQQQAQASATMSERVKPSSRSVLPNGIVYVMKESNESGVGSIQDEFTPEVLDAWLQHDASQQIEQVDLEQFDKPYVGNLLVVQAAKLCLRELSCLVCR